MKDLQIIDLARMGYAEALKVQLEYQEKRQLGEIADTLLLVEHDPVITMGRRATGADLLASWDFLKEKGVEVHEVKRGGEATYHGPGQIVGYCIFDLDGHDRDIKQFILNLEEVIIQFLKKEYEIDSGRDDCHHGVWIADRKVAAVGIAMRRRVTMHGFALNVNTNLEHFSWIVPCGITDKGVESLERLTSKKHNLEEVKAKLLPYFTDILGYKENGL